MSNKMVFRPIVGTNAQILNQTPVAGYVWFATDTKKIYYSDGSSFLSMGGNAGIYYGVKTIPEDTPSDQVDFIFYVDEIDGNALISDGNYKIPNVDDLILNSDGSFYRVKSVVELNDVININVTRLTVSGANGPVGPSQGVLQISDIHRDATKYFTKDTEQAELEFRVMNATIPDNNGIVRIKYTIGAIDVVEDFTYRDFGTVKFDLLPYIPRLPTSSTTVITVFVEDAYGVKGKYDYYINVVELSLESGYKNSILMTDTGIFNYVCKPKGGTNLDAREVVISFYDENDNHLNADIIEPVTLSNTELPIEIVVPDKGAFKMEVAYRGKLKNDKWVYSNILTYQMVYYDEEPRLVVNVPTMKVEQYGTLNITYMIAAKTSSVDQVEVKLRKGNNESTRLVDYNTLVTWSIYFDTPGMYDLAIEAIGITKQYPNIQVYAYQGSVPAINPNGLTLNLSAVNRSNTELNKDSWTFKDVKGNIYTCAFSDFAWGAVNGWMKDENGEDMLHLSAGAKLEVSNLFPFDINAMTSGQTIELDFKVSGVTDFSAGLIECLSYQDAEVIQTGFQVTGQGSTFNTWLIKATKGEIKESDKEEDQVYNTAIQGCTARFIENERIHLTWVIESSTTNEYPMIKTYLNGILCGITQYGSEDQVRENPASPATMIFDSTYGNIDIYNIRVYKQSALAENVVLNNFIATCGAIDERTRKYIDNKTVLDNNNNISIETIESENILNNYILSVPYIKIIGGQGMEKDDEGYYLKTTDTDECRLPNAKKDYRLVEKYEFIDQSGTRQNQILESVFKDDGYLNGIAMYGQGTSSMEYPVKNLRLKAKMRDADNNKVKFPVNDCEVDLVCLKADYMESSGSHNTGTGNLVYTLTKELKMQTPGQQYWQDKVDYDVVSAIRGFPVMVFFKPATADPTEPYEFIGKYNFNLDKATHEPFGFQYDKNGTFGWTPNTYKFVGKIKEKAYNEYPFDLYVKNNDASYVKASSYNGETEYYTIDNHVHCYEFLNNASNLANFLNDAGEDFATTFNKTVVSEGKSVPNWFTSYESRYPEYADAQSTDITSWFRLCNWINSTNPNSATNTDFENAITIGSQTYLTDSKDYRLAKFKSEFDQYLDLDFTCFYYVLTHVLLMIDSRAKNLMMATWDDLHWYPIFYDMDTMLGLNNYGYNKYHYDVEDTDPNVYNGQASVLWNNFRVAFADEIQAKYEEMQKAGLTYNSLLRNYNENQADAVNESVYNRDSYYKYIRPFTEEFVDNSGDKTVIVKPGTRDYLYASQGSRSMHRKWWLYNRINYFNGKYLSSAYKDDRYVLRIYTPQKGQAYYRSVGTITEEEFNSSTYYIEQYDVHQNKTYIEATVYDSMTIYYVLESDTSKMDASIDNVIPVNDFLLTPLYNQYLSVAFGGENGQTTDPTYAVANERKPIKAPDGAVYNDTETYLYGGSMLKDLGDLSSQYLGRFTFPETTETKLEILTLGNPHNAYYNPNFSLLTIGQAAPYLKELELSNCSGLQGRGIDVRYCKNIQKIYATGTGISNITMPEYGVIEELRLPETITTLKLVEQSQLHDSGFTIGTCSYDPETKIRTYTNQSGRIILLHIDNTPIDSYSLVKSNPVQQFFLKDINWIINDTEDLVYDENENVIGIKALDKLFAANPIDGKEKSQALIGTITLKATQLSLTTSEAMFLYNKYCANTVFPNVVFIFDGLDIYDVNILNGNGTLLWGSKIIGADGKVSITEEILSNNGFAAVYPPTKSQSISHTYNFTGTWIFNNKEYDCSTLEKAGWPIISNLTPINGAVILTPEFDENLREYDITFKNPYEENFDITVTGKYGTKIKDILPDTIPYRSDNGLPMTDTYAHIGYNINENDSTAIEFGDAEIVTGPKTYYAIFEAKNVYDNIHYDDYYEFYRSAFVDPETNATTYGYVISPKTYTEDRDGSTFIGPILRGKITIPAFYKSEPVWGIEGFSVKRKRGNAMEYYDNLDITHVFVQPSNDNTIGLAAIRSDAFNKCKGLRYFDFTNSKIRIIDDDSFRETSLQPNYNYDQTLDKYKDYYFGDAVYRINRFAFNQLREQPQDYTIILPSSLTVLESRAFCYGTTAGGPSETYFNSRINIEIGSANNPSNLNLSLGDTEINSNTNKPHAIFVYNDLAVYNVIFYSKLYNKWNTKISKGVHEAQTVKYWLGGDYAKSGGSWTMYDVNGAPSDDEVTP